MGIPFTSPQAEFEAIREQWLDAVQELARKGVFVGGTAVSRFENDFAAYVGTEEAVGVGNGTDALFLALKALGVGPGDEVVTAANTFIATVEAIHHTGATPVLADCGAADYLLDRERARRAVTARTKAIIPVHLYGQMVDLTDWLPWAEERGIAIVEDCAQAAGARLNGRTAGSVGDLGCFSFYPDKNLGALGDGGAVTGSSPELIAKLRKLRNHGGETRYCHEFPGFNSRLDPLQALALELKLKRLDSWTERRRSIAAMYESYLDGIASLVPPGHRGDASHAFHLYVVQVEDRERVRKHLQKKGILTAVQYPLPVHLTPAFARLGYVKGDFPVSERAAERILSLPMHIGMTEESVRTVAEAVREALGRAAV